MKKKLSNTKRTELTVPSEKIQRLSILSDKYYLDSEYINYGSPYFGTIRDVLNHMLIGAKSLKGKYIKITITLLDYNSKNGAIKYYLNAKNDGDVKKTASGILMSGIQNSEKNSEQINNLIFRDIIIPISSNI